MKKNFGVGERIKTKREEHKWTQEELACRMGYSTKSTIAKIEAGVNDVSASKVEKFAKVLDTTIAYLMGWEDDLLERGDKNGIQLKAIRESHNITLEEFANEFHITVEELKQYESGEKKIPFSLVKAVADYFGITTYQQTGLAITAPVDNDFGVTMSVLKATDRWNKEVGVVEFSDDELTELINFANYLISKRKVE